MTGSISDSGGADTATPIDSPKTTSTGSKAAGSFNANTKIHSMNDLKEKAPEVYKAILQFLAQGMMQEQNSAQQRIKEANKRNYQE